MNDYVAIFDIGSNAVRLVIYDGPGRAPVKIHNERNICGLGAGMAETGHLNPEAVVKALDSLRRFAGLVAALKIRHVHAVATAAMREAADGPAFIAKVKKEFGLDVTVIDGEEEARLSALGVMMNGLGVNGVIGDFGGGSLELIWTENGSVKHKASLPIGSHRMHALATKAQRVKAIDAALDTVEFLKDCAGLDFTALGGAWRSIAKAHMHFSRYPLRVLDHYAMEGGRGHEFAALLARQSVASLEKTVGFTKKRVKDVSVASLVMERVLERLKPKRLVFSGTGLREGMLFERLPPAVKKQDALVAGCETFALRVSRFENLKAFHMLAAWMAPLFEKDMTRLVAASCLLSDSEGFEHEDYQAAHALQQILVLPFYGASHADRAFLALSQYVRYKGYLRRAPRAKDDEEHTRPAQRILGEAMTNLAVRVGLAQRAAYLLTGGALELLKHAALSVTDKELRLTLGPGAAMLNADAIRKAFGDLAAEMGKEAVIS